MTPSSDASPACALDANGEPTTESGSVTAVASSTDAPISHEDIAATDAAAAARVFRNASRAESTWRAYEHDWRVFVHWCVGNGHDPLPASPRTLEMFLATQAMPAGGRAPYSLSTIERRRAAVRLMHLGAGHPSPHASPEVVELMRGIANTLGAAPKRKVAALDNDICRMAAACDLNTLVGLRDKAVLLFGFAGAFRRSELVGLDLKHLDAHSRGYRVVIVSSKTDQAARGQEIAIPRQPGSAFCPVEALDAWLRGADIHEGPVFRRVFKGGRRIGPTSLSGTSVAAIVKRGALAIGVDPRLYAGHSLRRGWLSSAAANREDVYRMTAQSRHRDIRSVLAYVERETAFDNHPGNSLLRESPPAENDAE